jgi:hypothetical protein
MKKRYRIYFTDGKAYIYDANIFKGMSDSIASIYSWQRDVHWLRAVPKQLF